MLKLPKQCNSAGALPTETEIVGLIIAVLKDIGAYINIKFLTA